VNTRRAFCVFVWLLCAAGCVSQRPAPVIERGGARTPPATTPAAPAPERPEFYTVKPGDTLFSIARSNGLDLRQLRALNGMDERSTIQLGQVLRLRPPTPGQVAEASPSPPPEPQIEVNPAAAPAPIEARPLAAGPGAPAALPAAPGTPAAGTLATAPGAPAETGGTAPARGPIRTEPRVFKLPYSEENLAMIQRSEARLTESKPEEPKPRPEEIRPAEPRKEAPEAGSGGQSADSIGFIWPVNGRVIEKFEVKNKGIDIAAPEGDPVEAAAAGNVLYAGSGIRGYGQLLIIKHNDDFLSVYAHNNKLLVKQGDSVKQGQKIAEVGRTDADRPKLHFEIRRQGSSVDPLKYLPQK